MKLFIKKRDKYRCVKITQLCIYFYIRANIYIYIHTYIGNCMLGFYPKIRITLFGLS